MKHRLLVLAVIMSLLLTACGGPAAAPKKADITMMMWGDPAELEVWNKIVADFHTADPNITVKVDVSD